MQRELITVEKFYHEQARPLGLRLLAGAGGLKRIIREPTVNRPGLALAGFTRYFASKRLQVIGKAESSFLRALTPDSANPTTPTSSPTKSPASSSPAISTPTNSSSPPPKKPRSPSSSLP